MATAAPRERPLLIRVTPQMVVLFILAAAAAAATLVRADGMWDVPGTMGWELPTFVGMWALMMAAMMLPSVAPFASAYARTVQENRGLRLGSFAAGYLLVWSLMGIPAYGLALVADEYAGEEGAKWLAAGVFAIAGIYQLTPLKNRCLAHCRSPLGHLLRYAAFRGVTRDLRAGFEHGFVCAACCWGLMVILIALGVMNVPAMIALAAVIALEKVWRWGVHFSRAVGVAALAAAVAVIWEPGLAPGLTNEPHDHGSMTSDSMSMDGEAMDGDTTMDGDEDAMPGMDEK
jgi:predicted metal-binding membrane protein